MFGRMDCRICEQGRREEGGRGDKRTWKKCNIQQQRNSTRKRETETERDRDRERARDRERETQRQRQSKQVSE